MFGGVRVLDALRVNDQKSGMGIPTKALSDLANPIFKAASRRLSSSVFLALHFCQ